MGLIHETLFRNYHQPSWEIYLEDAGENIIKKTGLSRKELHRILTILHEERIIN